MIRTQTRETINPSAITSRDLHQMPIQSISQPGCYVDSMHGSLYRITPEMISIGGTPFQGIVSREPWNVTKISDDYTLPIDEARIIAANASLNINF